MAGLEEEQKLVMVSLENGQDDEASPQLSILRPAMLNAIAALERAETLAEIKSIHDRVSGIHEFAKLRKDGFGLQQAAAALRIRAEHKAGRALSEIERERGKRTDQGEKTKYQEVLETEGIGIAIAL